MNTSATIDAEHTFSLVIPAYNRAHLVSETIESALAQRKQFSEIIVVDDGSTDDTLAVLNRFGDRITVIHTENRGVQAARNIGIKAAKSDYITLCDSDDLLEPHFLQVYSDWLSANPSCDVLYCNFVSFNGSTVFLDRLADGPPNLYDGLEEKNGVLVNIPDLIPKIAQYQILFVTGMTLKRAMFDVIGEYNVAFNRVGAEDFEFTLRAVARAEVAYCKQSLVRVRRHDGNDSIDPMRHFIGEMHILDYFLKNNPGQGKHKPSIFSEIEKRCRYVFDTSFSRGDFELASAMRKKFKKLPSDLRFRVKDCILNLPPFFRQAVWRMTQK